MERQCSDEVHVIDTGCGMSPEQVAKATLPYVKADERKSGGLGLGLTIVSRSLEAAGGSLKIESQLGRGTRCTAEMIFKTANTLPGSRAMNPPARKKRVMIVDDIEMLIEGATEIINTLSHSVVYTAKNGAEVSRELPILSCRSRAAAPVL